MLTLSKFGTTVYFKVCLEANIIHANTDSTLGQGHVYITEVLQGAEI